MAAVNRQPQNQSINSAVVRVVGRGQQVEFTLDDNVPMETLEEGLRGYLDHVGNRFQGGRINLNLGSRSVTTEQVDRLRGLLEKDYRLTLTGLYCNVDAFRSLVADAPPSTPSTTEREARSSNGLAREERREKRPDIADILRQESRAGSQETLLMRGTCRSGTTIHNAGNVVILGDVHPGAEITATKDIIIFGRLGGIAHAGFAGADDAVIIALSIESPQLRIGGRIRFDAPLRNDRRSSSVGMGDMAVVRSGSIVVEPFVARSVWKQEE